MTRYHLTASIVILLLLVLLFASNALHTVARLPYPIAPYYQTGACIYYEQDNTSCDSDQ